MITILQITDAVQNVIATELNKHLKELPPITSKNVEVDFPEPDSQTCSTMFFIVPNYAENEELTCNADFSEADFSIFISCKRDKSENLIRKIYGYLTALEQTIWDNQELGGLVDFSDIVSSEFYPATSMDKTMAGIEAILKVRYAKSYSFSTN